MARTIKDARLETREARNRLKVQDAPHWRTLRPGETHLGYVRKRKDLPGHWTVRHYMGKHRTGQSSYAVERLSGFADDYETADGVLIYNFKQAQDLALKKKVKGVRSILTVRNVIEDYILYLRLEKATSSDAESRAEASILPVLGHIRVTDLTTAVLTKWRDDLAATPAHLHTRAGFSQKARPASTDEARRARRASANRIMTTLKAALNRAFKSGLVDDDLSWRRLPRFTKVDAARPGFLSVEEAQRVINSCDKETGFRDLVRAALATGCRYSELSRLKVQDFANNKLAILKSKSGKVRHIVLEDEGIALFQRLTIGRAGNEILLRNFGRVSEIWEGGDQTEPMKAVCKIAKIEPRIGFHALRHSWASLSVMAGMPLILVARNLGHVDTRMVERHYGHLSETYSDREIKKYAPRFGAGEDDNVTPLRARG